MLPASPSLNLSLNLRPLGPGRRSHDLSPLQGLGLRASFSIGRNTQVRERADPLLAAHSLSLYEEVDPTKRVAVIHTKARAGWSCRVLGRRTGG